MPSYDYHCAAYGGVESCSALSNAEPPGCASGSCAGDSCGLG